MGKILLVTGASSDVGIELIRNITKKYDKILAHYYHWNENLEQLKKENGSKIVFIQADFSSSDSVANMVCPGCHGEYRLFFGRQELKLFVWGFPVSSPILFCRFPYRPLLLRKGSHLTGSVPEWFWLCLS